MLVPHYYFMPTLAPPGHISAIFARFMSMLVPLQTFVSYPLSHMSMLVPLPILVFAICPMLVPPADICPNLFSGISPIA